MPAVQTTPAPDGTTRFSAEVERVLPAPARLAWALMADSNRWDRVIGLEPTTYTYDLLRAGDPRSRARVGHSTQMGRELTWTEAGEWVEGRLMWGERRYLHGSVKAAGFCFRFVETGSRTALSASAYVDCLPRAAATGTFLKAHFEATLQRYVEGVAALLERLDAGELSLAEPPVSTARRLLFAVPPDDLVNGPRTVAREADLAYHSRRLLDSPIDDAVRARLLALVTARADDEVRQLRPFELARVWGLSRRRVVRAFLHATRAGLFDLRWQLICPSCRIASETRGSLGELGARGHCHDCDASFDLDFSENVEAVFSVNPSIRDVAPRVYCGGSPWFRPHVLAVLEAAPGTTREIPATLPEGVLRVRRLGSQRSSPITVEKRRPVELHVRVGDGEVAPAATWAGEGDGTTLLAVTNLTDEPVTLLFERSGANADLALGSFILTMPDFHDLFSTDAPATGVELSVGSLTILFSDLTGSTALYERLGDARAFALVQQHFRDMAQLVARHDGAVVKTMGDAVMASFQSPADALAAALEMAPLAEESARAHGVDGLAVKVGLHHGPCLAARAAERLDFFGTTVNIASRLQCAARAGEVMILAALRDHPAVASMLAALPTVREQEAEVAGLAEPQRMLAIAAR
jgi:class 3 adenylate cyclase